MAKKRIKRYKVSPDESLCLAVSVVDSPAVESDFQFFSQQKIEKFVGVDGERRMLYGCALRPDFPIYRNDGKEEYYLEFSKEAIDKISKNYFKMGFQSNWTEAHKDEVEGLTVTESWIKESMTQDKSVALGLDPSLPIGTWFLGCHCENDDIWEKVKAGTYHGFSIEAIVGVEEFEKQVEELNDNNMDTNSNEEMFLNKLRNVLKEFFNSKKEEAQETEPNVIESTNVDLEEQTPPAAEPAPVVETPQEAPKTEEPAPVQETPKQEPVEPENKPQEAPKEDDKHLEELINSLKDEIKALKEMNNGLEDKIKDLGKTPSAAPINTNSKSGGGGSTYTAWREQMRQYIGG